MRDPGMNLRDYFAAQAFGAVVGGVTGMADTTKTERMAAWGILAELVYEAADAMLAEREKGADQ